MTDINTRQIAERLIRDHATVVDTSSIDEQLDGLDLSPERSEAAIDEIRELVDTATVTVTWDAGEAAPRHG